MRTGLAFLPMSACIVASAQIAARLVTRVPIRLLLVSGLLLVAGGMLYLSRLQVDSGYASGVLPAQAALGAGMGLAMMASISTATLGVDPRDAGVGSAMVNTASRSAARSGPPCSTRWRPARPRTI